jgi:hypothetical protein
MTKKGAIVAVYNPPKPGLPFLAVSIEPNGKVAGMATMTAAEAQAIVDHAVAKLRGKSPDR